MSDQPALSFLSHFSGLNDPRQAAKVLYPLPEIWQRRDIAMVLQRKRGLMAKPPAAVKRGAAGPQGNRLNGVRDSGAG